MICLGAVRILAMPDKWLRALNRCWKGSCSGFRRIGIVINLRVV